MPKRSKPKVKKALKKSASAAKRGKVRAHAGKRPAKMDPDMKLKFFYDQSILVRDSVRSVWEAIFFGLVLSVVILLAFLLAPAEGLLGVLTCSLLVAFLAFCLGFGGLVFWVAVGTPLIRWGTGSSTTLASGEKIERPGKSRFC